MLAEIKFEDSLSKDYRTENDKLLSNINRINIFIGANNSGKSRFIRRLFSSQEYYFIDDSIHMQNLELGLSQAIKEVESYVTSNFIGDFSMLLNKIKKVKDALYMPVKLPDNTNVEKNVKHIFSLNGIGNHDIQGRHVFDSKLQQYVTYNLGNLAAFLNTKADEYLKDPLARFNRKEKSELVFERHYIPILRSLRGINPATINGYDTYTDTFKDIISKQYSLEGSKDNIFTGLSLYDESKRLLLGDTEDRKRIREFELFLSKSFFESRDVNIVPRLQDTLHIKIDNVERPIHDLGDGIQSIIILTYPLFFNKGKNAVFFFEEPEMHLHPGYQRLFMETLQRQDFGSYQYFMTTHSNHFLDITLDYDNISVYTFQKEDDKREKFIIQNVSSGDDNVLKLIGARTSSVFLSNCTIWVEGITDRIYIRKYLELYQKKHGGNFKEDYNYSFVEYAGNNITHWSFLDSQDPNHANINVERLCAKLFLITDRDGAGKNKDGSDSKKATRKQLRHQALERKLGDRYYCLNCREIENLLAPQIIKLIIQGREPDNNSIDFTQFDKKSYSNEYLGKYIDTHVKGKGAKNTYSDPAGSGTLIKKDIFAKEATKLMTDFDYLSDEAKELTKRLYLFIEKHNS